MLSGRRLKTHRLRTLVAGIALTAVVVFVPSACSGDTTRNSGPWSYAHGEYSFTQSDGKVLQPVIKVIDVSEHQKSIDWQKVKQAGVDAAILRVGYGYGNEDKYFKENLAGARVNRIRYGLYLYSYAYDTEFAREEANYLLKELKKYSITDTDVPIFYDLEHTETWDGHKMPTDAAEYEKIAKAFFEVLENAGYTNVGIYTYANNMTSRMNSTWLRSHTSWIASYGDVLSYNFKDYSGPRAWQYTSTGRVNGITGNVDISVFEPTFFTGSTITR